MRRSRLHAFNLLEILAVLAIIGILILLALPNHASAIAKAKAVEAKTQLQHLQSLQKMYFYEHSKYAATFDEIGYEPAKLVADGGNGNYSVHIASSGPQGFKAIATATVDFDGDGVFNVWEIDQEKNLIETVKD